LQKGTKWHFYLNMPIISSMKTKIPKIVNGTLKSPLNHFNANILAMLYAPYVTKRKENMLLEKLNYYLEKLDLPTPEILVNPSAHIRVNEKEGWYKTVVVGWGLPERPQWDALLRKYDFIKIARQFLAFDLFERFGIDGRILDEPRVDAGKYWGLKVQEGHLKHFLQGYFVKSVPPYGMKRVSRKAPDKTSRGSHSHFVLVPGDPEEIQIVRLIFDLFINHDYNRSDISNLLNAQGVEPPGRKTIWKSDIVGIILRDPVYIGANYHQRTIRYDVFPSILDKFIFYEAQAKIMRERIPREVLQSINHEVTTKK
jgi:hypothetical protein